MKVDRFGKNYFLPKEKKIFTFYFIGNCEKYSDFTEVFFHSLENKLWEHPFYLKEIRKERLEETLMKGNKIEIDTVVENKPLDQIIQDLLNDYQTQYNFQSNFSCGKISSMREIKIQEDVCFLGTRKIRPIGKIGTYSIKNIELPKFLLEIGIGQWNYLGGGKFAIKNTIDKGSN